MPAFFDRFLQTARTGQKAVLRHWRYSRAGQYWNRLHARILKHAGLGGKSHSFERGHVTWNRKGRW
ncbi:MAG: hypothetical protein D6715_10980 [Calditrichaeota bacterium]|nr:MAG: hypothetical protein D6715_10980 [Calditrichota bacterium]